MSDDVIFANITVDDSQPPNVISMVTVTGAQMASKLMDLEKQLSAAREELAASQAGLRYTQEMNRILSNDLGAARAELADIKKSLLDVPSVRANIMRGAIAIPDDLVFFHDTNGPVEKLRQRIAELEAAQAWIPCAERLPENGQVVYAWIQPYSYVPGSGKECTYMPSLNITFPWRATWDMAMYSPAEITHWCPLPPPPAE